MFKNMKLKVEKTKLANPGKIREIDLILSENMKSCQFQKSNSSRVLKQRDNLVNCFRLNIYQKCVNSRVKVVRRQPLRKAKAMGIRTQRSSKVTPQLTPICSSRASPVQSNNIAGSDIAKSITNVTRPNAISLHNSPDSTPRHSINVRFNCNEDLHHASAKSSVFVPKLTLENLNNNNFQKEFLSKAEEFSASWREALAGLKFK